MELNLRAFAFQVQICRNLINQGLEATCDIPNNGLHSHR
jgi:hypothetical protein